MKVAFNFPPLVAVLQWLLRLIIHLAERMLGIADSFTDDFQRFGHSLLFLCSSLARREECQWPFPGPAPPCLIIGIAASSTSNIGSFRGFFKGKIVVTGSQLPLALNNRGLAMLHLKYFGNTASLSRTEVATGRTDPP